MRLEKQLGSKFMNEIGTEEAKLKRSEKILYGVVGVWYSSFLIGLASCAYQSRYEIAEDFLRIFSVLILSVISS